MERLPHDYLRSELKEEIEIRFYRDCGRTVMELFYVERDENLNKKRLWKISQTVRYPELLPNHIIDAEMKLIKEYKKSDAQRKAENEETDRRIV
jgi:hypothetical protein